MVANTAATVAVTAAPPLRCACGGAQGCGAKLRWPPPALAALCSRSPLPIAEDTVAALGRGGSSRSMFSSFQRLRPPPWTAATFRQPHPPQRPAAGVGAGGEATVQPSLPPKRLRSPPIDAAALAAAASTAAVVAVAPPSSARGYLPPKPLVRSCLSALLVLSVAAAATVPIGLLVDVVRAAATATASADAAAAGHRAAWAAAGCRVAAYAPEPLAAAASSVGLLSWLPRSVRVWRARRAAVACTAAAVGGWTPSWAPVGLIKGLSAAAPAAAMGRAVDAALGGVGWWAHVVIAVWALIALVVVPFVAAMVFADGGRARLAAACSRDLRGQRRMSEEGGEAAVWRYWTQHLPR